MGTKIGSLRSLGNSFWVKTTAIISTVLTSIVLFSCTRETTYQFNVDSGEAVNTFGVFAEQAEVGIVFDGDGIHQIRTNHIEGEMSIDEAIGLMIHNTGLGYSYNSKVRLVSVVKKS